MQEKYYLSKNDKELGPFSVSEIVAMVKSGELRYEDFAFCEKRQDWFFLTEIPEIFNQLPKDTLRVVGGATGNEVASEPGASPTSFRDCEWYVLKGENRFGPFSYIEVVRMLQEKSLFEFDFVWYDGLQSWTRVAEMAEFNPDQIRNLHQEDLAGGSEVFFRRRHARVKFGGAILVHDNKSLWKGRTIEIGEGGAGVILAHSLLVPGQKIHLHFKPGQGAPAFNAHCEVVSKQFTKEAQRPGALVRYGLKFLEVQTPGKNFVAELTQGKKAA